MGLVSRANHLSVGWLVAAIFSDYFLLGRDTCELYELIRAYDFWSIVMYFCDYIGRFSFSQGEEPRHRASVASTLRATWREQTSAMSLIFIVSFFHAEWRRSTYWTHQSRGTFDQRKLDPCAWMRAFFVFCYLLLRPDWRCSRDPSVAPHRHTRTIDNWMPSSWVFRK